MKVGRKGEEDRRDVVELDLVATDDLGRRRFVARAIEASWSASTVIAPGIRGKSEPPPNRRGLA